MKGELLTAEKVQPLYQEAEELTAIFVSSVRSAQANQKSAIKNQKSEAL
jgi:hypothetical protein